MKTPDNRGGSPRTSGKTSFFDDGVDSRKNSTKGLSRSRSALHEEGLCSQVAEALNLVFSGVSGDARLWDLELLSVEPAPNASRLLVTIHPRPSDHPRTVPEIHAMLKAARSFLRCEVAGAISRRRTPELVFEVVPGPERRDENGR